MLELNSLVKKKKKKKANLYIFARVSAYVTIRSPFWSSLRFFLPFRTGLLFLLTFRVDFGIELAGAAPWRFHMQLRGEEPS